MVAPDATVLLIEDEPAIGRMLSISFEQANLGFLEAATAADGIRLAVERRPDLILLDLGLPDSDGLNVIESVRSWSSMPIIVLSGRGQEKQKVRCLEAGADDYVTKPFGVAELVARIRAALRRNSIASEVPEEPVFETGDLKVDMAARRVFLAGEEVHLAPLEYKLLCVLIKYAGKVVTHRQLLQEVWGAEYSDEAQYLRVYMGYLRRKLEPTPDSPRLFVTEPRVGYRLIG